MAVPLYDRQFPRGKTATKFEKEFSQKLFDNCNQSQVALINCIGRQLRALASSFKCATADICLLNFQWKIAV